MGRREAALGFAAMAGVLLLPARARAAGNPVGDWTTIDDETGQPKSVVRISERDGKLYGKILKLIDPPEPNPKCKECSGSKRDQPIEGLEILWGLEPDGDEWSGGYILDPKNGKQYRCYIEVLDGGKRLKVRGYIGVSLFGRTQYWKKAG